MDELLATEQEIAARLVDAERQATQLLAEAAADVEKSEREAEAALVRELAAIDEAAHTERESAARAIEAKAKETVMRYRSLDGAVVERLAAWVATELTGLGVERAS